VAFVGCDPIASDAELERRLAQFRHYEEAGGRAYTYTLAALGDEDQVMAERIAELEALHRFGHQEQTEAGVSQTPAPAPDSDGSAPNHQSQDTTEPAQRQAALEVGYLGAFPPPPQAHATGELVQFYRDGEPTDAPAHSVAETRLWLAQHGFKPDYTLWQALDRAVPEGLRRRRLEVYVADEPPPQAEGPASGWWGAACATPRRTAEDEARWEKLARERFGDNGRKADEPFIPESGQGADLHPPYAKLRG